MKIFIDAYNFLKCDTETHADITERQRRIFISQCNRYGKKKGHELVVVFDGGDSSLPHEYHEGYVRVIYAGYVRTADEVIEQKLLKPNAPVVLVTNDRALKDAVKSSLVVTISCAEFSAYLSRALSCNQVHIKRKKDSIKADLIKCNETSHDIDMLMNEYAQTVSPKREDVFVDVVSTSGERKLSKKERKIKHILDKL